jgi:protein involved in polysaccharide export with SLBB domain
MEGKDMGGTKGGFLRTAAVVAAFVLLGIDAGSGAAYAVEPGNEPSPMGPTGPSGENRSPAEIAASLEAQGIPPERMQQMLTEMNATQEGSTPNTDPGASDVQAPVDRTVQAPPAAPADSAGDWTAYFGYSLFESSPDTYRQPTLGPVDPSYPLGPGDEIVLDVWGDAVFRLERTLDREGGVNLPDVGRVVLAGMTLDGARETLRRRLASVYSGLSQNDARATTHLSVTLGNLRVIRAFVVGRARRPGGYDLSAASTVFHALFFAGGPTLGGSMRDVRLVRAGKEIATLDVYEYLRSGKRIGGTMTRSSSLPWAPV